MSRRPAAFTLLELLIALALAGVLIGIAVPALNRPRETWRLQAAARQVVMDLKLARARAIASGTSQRLRFAVPGAAYQHERQRAPGAYAASGPATALPDGVTVADCTAAGDAVSFRPRGHAASFGTITLRNRYDETRRVVVDIAGRLRVQ